ncbi:hypothetical protein PGB34_18385 [Xenophilus arseniciresistens]|uniref:Uncharacterized protein n=1 Tax=Xenophilus arseniciresistens TaxID=1283306 RepID=A0AAE3T197_9BURK|nr:hypothetical protein [Xenophilus arseniciresistens]MDA7418340.1 hypothetical protein [Xenophilus arseniciresistens]
MPSTVQPPMNLHTDPVTDASAEAAAAAAPEPAARKPAAAPRKRTAAKKAAAPTKVPAKAPVKKAAAPARPAAPAQVGKSPKAVKAVKAEKPVKLAKPAKEKLVRDSFTMPPQDFGLIAQMKERALAFKRPAKKSELLRAGLQVLAKLSDAQLKKALDALTPLKAGRPRKLNK